MLRSSARLAGVRQTAPSCWFSSVSEETPGSTVAQLQKKNNEVEQSWVEPTVETESVQEQVTTH